MADTYYQILEVANNCSQDDIEKAYKKAALKYHPDRNPGDEECAAKFLKIQEAYDNLKDQNKRREYDHRLKFGNRRVHINEVENLDIRIICKITIQEAVLGTKKAVSVFRKKPCDKCSGDGFTSFMDCHVCNGRGSMVNNFGPMFRFETVCPNCVGQGKVGVNKCLGCSGSKYKTGDETKLDVVIPPGVVTGNNLAIAGYGHEGRFGQVGNIIVQIQMDEDQRYQIRGLDIHFDFEVDFSTMLFGGKIEIPTFENELIELEIPEKTKNLTNFRVKGKGMPHLQNNLHRGDIVANVITKIPEKEFSQELKKLLKLHGV